ncbi:MAG: AI-2E family transporter [Candidatus Absconditicoccaceae bacterium]
MKELKKVFQDLFKKFKLGEDKELKELKKIENQLKKLKDNDVPQETGLIFSGKSMFKFWIIGLLVVFLGYISFKSLETIYLILAAYILSVAMEAIIDFFERIKFRRGLAIAVTYILLMIFVLAGFVFVVPFIFTQLSELIKLGIGQINDIQILLTTKSLPEIVNSLTWIPNYMQDNILNYLNNQDLVGGLQVKLQENIAQIAQMGSTYAQYLGNRAVSIVGSFFSFVGQAAIVLTLAVLFSIEKKSVIRFVSGIGSLKSREYLVIRLEKIYKQLGIWLKSQLLLCVFIGVTVYAALWILSLFGMDLPSKGSLAMIAGLTEFIPYLGPIFASVAAVMVALLNYGIYGALIVLAVFFAIQRLENNVFIPLLMNKTLGVNPVVVFVSMIIGGLIMGFLGVLLSVPIAVIITLMVEKDE